MKGVKAIAGISEIKAGKMVTFYVKTWHTNTPEADKHLLKWDLYEIKNGEYIKLKTFYQGKLQFSEKEIGKQYLVVGYLYEAELHNASAMTITVVPTEKVQILSVEIRDINGNTITKPLAYGVKIKVYVRTTGLQKHKIFVELWEDDAAGAGHNTSNTKVNIATKLVPVSENGIAVTEMLIPDNFKKFAEARSNPGGEGNTHEYYVTAYYDGTQLLASGNINLINTKTREQRKQESTDHLENKPKKEEKLPAYKGKVPKTQPSHPATPAPHQPAHKPAVQHPAVQHPAQQAPVHKPAPVAAKKEISSVYLTDDFYRPITGTIQGGTIKVHIISTGLINKLIRFRLLEEDPFGNDEVINQKFKIDKDHYIINVTLKNVSRSKGDDFFEGSEQEFFVDIEVLDTHAHIKSAVIDVDVKALKQDVPTNVTKTKVEQPDAPKNQSCGERYCIKKGEKSELIREINIRLAGFGGNVPTDEFTDRTEKMIKQFQRDYMKVPETGKVCGNVLRAIDDFSTKFDIGITFWNQLKCSCGTKGEQATSKLRKIKEKNNCSGFGDHTGKETYRDGKPKTEAFHMYEYPGIHRSLLFGLKTLKYYFSIENEYSLDHLTSGYRCRFKNYNTTNHQGKAIDIQFSKGNWGIRGAEKKNIQVLKDIYNDIFKKFLNAKYQWVGGRNNFSTEPIDLKYTPKGDIDMNYTYSWIHLDVREFDNEYLDDKYFCINSQTLNGKSIVELARNMGFNNLCNCFNNYNNQNQPKPEKKNSNERVDPKTLNLSDKGKQFIKDWESFKSNPYNDSEGYCTIGYGHLIKKKKCEDITIPDEFKNGITEKRASELFELRLKKFEAAIKRDITAPLYQYEYDALVSLVFNTGENFLNTGGKNNGETKIKKNINNQEYEAGANEMKDVTNGGTSGLVKRRNAEIKMFKNNIYDSTH